jgi:hypothetical protein
VKVSKSFIANGLSGCAALPPDVRRGFAFPASFQFFSGAMPPLDLEAQPLK